MFDLIPTDCLDTFEKTQDELEAIELKLALRLGVSGGIIRRTLLRLDNENRLVEDELVRDWHATYARFVNWIDKDGNGAGDELPVDTPQPRTPTTDEAVKGAADDAALLFSAVRWWNRVAGWLSTNFKKRTWTGVSRA